MTVRSRTIGMLIAFLCSFGIAVAQEAIENWPAPAVWSPPEFVVSKGEVSPSEVEGVEAVPTSPLHFVGITPCRVADTRGNGFTGQYGPPALTPVGRNMVITGRCGIPAEAQAVSFNFSAVNVPAAGFFVAYPAGGAFPPVATMTYNQNTPNLSNAAVVPLGTGGAITVVAAVTTIDLVVDVNGYYSPGVVTTLNGLTGNVSLAAGSNVTITPSGQTLTVEATGGEGGLLPTGTDHQTLRHDGSNWVASSALRNNGTDVTLTGALNFASLPLRITYGPNKFAHTETLVGDLNTFLGIAAGGLFADTGSGNTGLGFGALEKTSTGSSGNTAVGGRALLWNSTGDQNVAIGSQALNLNSSGNQNIAIGADALLIVNSGSGNIAIGTSVGSSVSTGSNNLYIGSASAGNESNQIRIGRNDVHTQGTVIASIYGLGSGGGIPVIVNSGGRLGTTTSSVRYKDDVRDIGLDSEGLMDLRPVAFKYKPGFDPTGLRQYGLIAEDVAQIYPELVVYDEEGRPQAIRSQLFEGLFLNEIQKQHRRQETQETTISEQTRLIARQQAQLDELRAKLAEIETRIESGSH